MFPANQTATLLDYARSYNIVEFRAYHELTKNNAPKALFDSRVVWMSAFALSLWDDRSDMEFWRRFAAQVEVVQITSIRKEWAVGL
jgi:hypothetical protein